MKIIFTALFALFCVIAFSGCQKEKNQIENDVVVSANSYTQPFTVQAGGQVFSPANYTASVPNPTPYPAGSTDHGGEVAPPTLAFYATFINTQYTTAQLGGKNQVNKLYGFTDCGAAALSTTDLTAYGDVLDYSGRFGWWWVNGQLQIIAISQIKGQGNGLGEANEIFDPQNPIATIQPNKKYYFSIDAPDGSSVYTLIIKDPVTGIIAGKQTIQRGCTSGGKHLNTPYFGGKIAAPSAMEIDIENL